MSFFLLQKTNIFRQDHWNRLGVASLISLLVSLTFTACESKDETGSCNQFCGNTQIASVQTRATCAAMGAESKCFTKWLRKGADERDRNAWEIVYPVPVVIAPTPGPDITPPPQPNLVIDFSADNEIRLWITKGNISEPYRNDNEVTRNGTLITFENNYAQLYDSMLDELTQYCYSVVAIDSSGNRSVSSLEHCLTTPVSPLKSSTTLLANQWSGSSVVGSDGSIYGGSPLSALNSIGTLQWTSLTFNSKNLPIIGSDGIIYIHSLKKVYAFFSDGTESWSHQVTGERYHNVKVSSDTVYISADNYIVINGTFQYVSNITALNLDGTLKWKYIDAKNRSLAVKELSSDGTPYLYVGGVARAYSQIQALTLTGSLKWEYVDANNSELTLNSVGNNGKSYIETRTPGATLVEDIYKVQVLNVAGVLDWEYVVPSKIKELKVADDGAVFISSYSPPLSLKQNIASIEALNSSGAFKWNYTVELPSTSINDYILFENILLANDGKIYFSDTRELRSLNSDGTLNWVSENMSLERSRPNRIQLMNDNSLIFIAGRRNKQIVSFGTNGKFNWRYAMKDEDAYTGPSRNAPLNKPLQVLNEVVIFGGSNFLVFNITAPQ